MTENKGSLTKEEVLLVESLLSGRPSRPVRMMILEIAKSNPVRGTDETGADGILLQELVISYLMERGYNIINTHMSGTNTAWQIVLLLTRL